jgi:2-keto-4-pentenoate hydratase/2-oxohepta-3-ene-1,7-dioic acid hydratase in catechol pathway
MRLATFRSNGHRQVGRLTGDGQAIEPFDLAAGLADAGLSAVIDRLPPTTVVKPVPLDRVRLEAPIPRPHCNIFCVGKNYFEHAHEFARSGFDSSAQAGAVPDSPIVFSKVPESVTGPGDPILIDPTVSQAVDYEAELAVVIGKGGRAIRRADAVDHVWGYCIVNDVTARDLQGRHKQWLIGKSQDSFCPDGPVAGEPRRDRPGGHARALLGQRRTAAGRQHPRPDFRRADADRDDLGRSHAHARRHHRHGHAGRRRHRLQSAEIPQAR